MRFVRVIALVLALVLTLSLLPGAVDGNLLFVAVNDSIPLTLSALPYTSSGTLFVPYTVFDAVPGGVNQAYNATEQTFVLFTRERRMIFDLKAGTVVDEEQNSSKLATAFKNGVLYIPLKSCCAHFGLNAVMLESKNGYPVLRFTTGSEVYDDNLFIEKAENLIAYRIGQLSGDQPEQPAIPETPARPETPATPAEPPEEQPVLLPATVYPVIVGAAQMEQARRLLESHSLRGAFFLTEAEIRENPELVRLLYVSGHKLGVTVEPEQKNIPAALRAANRALDAVLNLKSLMALLPADTPAPDGYRVFFAPSEPLSAEEAAAMQTPQLFVCSSDAAADLQTFLNAGANLRLLRETTQLGEETP